jgi:hypothetical protein
MNPPDYVHCNRGRSVYLSQSTRAYSSRPANIQQLGSTPIRSLTAYNRGISQSSGWKRAQARVGFGPVPSGIAAQASAGPTQVMRGKIPDGRSFGTVFHDMPDYPLRDTVSPSLTRPANAPEHAAFPHAGGRKPGVDCALDPNLERAPSEHVGLCRPNPRRPSDCHGGEDVRGPVLPPLSAAGRIQREPREAPNLVCPLACWDPAHGAAGERSLVRWRRPYEPVPSPTPNRGR